MIREHLFHKRAPADPMFRWRGGDVSRMEALSDGVFAVTLTLLNGAFLFLVVFYAYPLKFMAMFLWRMVRGQNTGDMFALPAGVQWTAGFGQAAGMMYFYGLGVVGVFGLLALMVWRAYYLRDELELDELESFLTLASIRVHLITVGVATLSIIVQATTGNPGLSGMTYFLMGPLTGVAGWRAGVRAEAIQERLTRS